MPTHTGTGAPTTWRRTPPNNLTAQVRTETGKGASRRARRDGKVPAVLYGHGADPQHLELHGHDFAAVLRNSGTNAVLTLDIDGKEQLALTKALDIHPIRRNIQHADLLVVRRGEKVTVEVNVVVEGEAAPGTLVTQETNTIEIEADVQSIPEQLTCRSRASRPAPSSRPAQLQLPVGRHAGVRPRAAGRQRRRRADRRGTRGRGRRCSARRSPPRRPSPPPRKARLPKRLAAEDSE